VLIPNAQSACGHDVHGRTEQLGELVLEVQQVEERAAGLELDEEADVPVVVLIAAGNGPEHGDGPSMVPARQSFDRVAMMLDE